MIDYHQWEGELCKMCGVPQRKPTAECPKRRLSNDELDKVQRDYLDFREGRWRTYVDLPAMSGEKDNNFTL